MVLRVALGAALGAALGLLVWRLTRSGGDGTCMFFCRPERAALTGALFGLLWSWQGTGGTVATGFKVSGLMPRRETMQTTVASGVPVHVDEASFEGLVTGTTLPILLDAYADWCGPCRMLAPELEAVARELDGKVIVAKLNTDENQNLAAALRIRGIPALFVIKNQRVVDAWTGYRPADEITARLKPHLAD